MIQRVIRGFTYSQLLTILIVVGAACVHPASAAVALLEMVSPRGGEVYIVGQSQQVRLNSKFKSVTIELSRDGGATYTQLGIIDNAVKDKTLLNLLKYTVTGPSSSNCIIRARGLTTKGETIVESGGFAITAGGTLAPVTETDLADGSVTTPKLAARAVTDVKIGSGAASNNMVLQADGTGGVFFGPLAGVLDSALSPNVTLKGNTFNAANKLALLDGSGNVPVNNLPTAGVTPATRGVMYVDQTTIQVMSDGKITAIGALPPTVAGGDLTGTYPNPSVATVGGQTATNIASGVQAANGATNTATANTIVERDASGNFAAGTITANLTGLASNAAALNGKPDTAFSLAGHNHFGESWTGNSTGPGLKITNSDLSSLSSAVFGQTASTSGAGLEGIATATTGSNVGVYGESASVAGLGVYGFALATTGGTAGVYGQSSSSSGAGVQGRATATTGGTVGVFGDNASSSGNGVQGRATSTTGSAYGVRGDSASTSGAGVFGIASATSGGTDGVYGETASNSGAGVQGRATTTSGNTAGVRGDSASTSGFGVYGNNTATTGGNATGVYGETASTTGAGVQGIASATTGVNVGIYGTTSSASGYAGFFNGNVQVSGFLSKSAGTFKIDHPLDPANKYLFHSFVESPDMKNVYDGVTVIDANGESVVELPSYFQALNRDYRYQLTCLGGFSPVYISEEIVNNRFKIAGGKTGLKVSWQVTGIRKDAFAAAHPITVEQDKPADERGLYLHPVEHGQSADKGLNLRRASTSGAGVSSVLGQAR